MTECLNILQLNTRMEEEHEQYEDLEQENAEYRDMEEQSEDDNQDQMGESYMEGEQTMGVYREQYSELPPGQEDQSQQSQHNQQPEDLHEELNRDLTNRKSDRSQQSDDLNGSFERDVDTITKIKATIMYNINVERERNGASEIYEDITLSSIANQFAISLKGKQYDKNYLEKLNGIERNDIRIQNMKPLYIISGYQQDAQVTKQVTYQFFIEMGHLFFQMDQQRRILLDSSNNHIGVGLAGNETNIVIVLFVVSRDLCITGIAQKGDLIEVKGKMLDPTVGICGVKVYNSESFQKMKKEKDKQDPDPIFLALQDKMDYSKTTKQFTIYLEFSPNWKQKRWIQLFTRENPDGITYKKPRKDDHKIYFKHLKPKLRALFVPYPNALYQQYYSELKEQNFQKNKDILEDMIKKEEEQKLKQQQAQMELYQHRDNDSGSDKQDSERSDDDQGERGEGRRWQEENREGAASNKQIRQELQLAIIEAKKSFENLMLHNRQLQEQIKDLKNKHQGYTQKGAGDMTMNEHKYLNTLTQVHQTRIDLQSTQDRYNRMSLELQNKLTEKQNRCNQIRAAFQELKREVTKKAAYSRSDQPIKPTRITEWEDQQKRQAEQLQNLRLQILRARNTLAKNQKILKKKEQLAEGLHLIDFEQLKIQNQTLNERIEERNEDLHKLKKKTTTIVQTLTHTRQKLGFVKSLKQKLDTRSSQLQILVNQIRDKVNQKKTECEDLKVEIQTVKQQTEIVNSQELVVDYKKRTTNIIQLQAQIKQLQRKEKDMKDVIKNYQTKMKKSAIA